jgi:VWFA-related protein
MPRLPSRRAFAGFLLTGVLFAQQDKPTFISNVRIVMTPVTVTDRGGNIIPGLTPADFRLLDNGKLQKIDQDMASHPMSMVIAVQANDKVEKILPQIQKLGSAIQQQILGDEGEVAILEFDHRMQTLSDFTSDPDAISKALKKLKPGSTSSRLNDAAIEAINLLKKRPETRRKVLLLISESRDNGSELKPREVLSAAEFANVNIYSIDISHLMSSLTAGPSANRSVLDNRPPGAVYQPNGAVETPTTQAQAALGNWVPLLDEIFIAAKGVFVPNPLKVYTTYTGGRQYSFMTQRELERAVSDLGAELHSQYLLTYTPNNQEEGGFHNIIVQVLKPDLKVRARDGYYIAGGKPQ